jgi:hypothetical protein
VEIEINCPREESLEQSLAIQGDSQAEEDPVRPRLAKDSRLDAEEMLGESWIALQQEEAGVQ